MKQIITLLLFLGCAHLMYAAPNIGLNEIDVSPYLPPGDHNLRFSVYNTGDEPITEFTIEWEINGVSIAELTLDGFSIPVGSTPSTRPLYYMDVINGISLGAATNYEVSMVITSVNGVSVSGADKQMSHNIYKLSNVSSKKVLLEKLAATWCGNCPCAEIVMENILGNYPFNTLAAVIHRSSSANAVTMPYSADYPSNSYLSVEGQPKGLLDRKYYESVFYNANPSEVNSTSSSWELNLVNRLADFTPVQLSTSTTYDASTRALTIDVDANFLAPLDGDYRFNVFILENGIIEPQTNYNSSCGPSGTISDYEHNHVVRDMLGGVWGTAGSIPSGIVEGTQASYQYNYTVPMTSNPDNMEVYVLVQKNGDNLFDKEILNVLEVDLNGSNAHSLTPVGTSACVPPTAPSLNSSGGVICPGDVITLATDDAAPTGYGYQWQLNGVDIAGATSAEYNATLAGSYSVYFTDNADEPCASDNSSTVNIQQGGIPNLNVNNIEVNGLTVSFSASIMGTGDIVWAFGDGDSAFVANPVHTYDAPGTYVVCITASNECGTGGGLCNLVEVGNASKFYGSVLLEGAYEAGMGSMRTDLNSLLPTDHPYNDGPYAYLGAEFANSIPNNAVDWVVVEARSGTLGTSMSQTTVVERRAALLLDDGSIVDVDGASGVGFNSLVDGQEYYFVVRHRNHLDVISATTVIATTTMIYDFTTSANQAAGVEQLRETQDGRFAMLAGDYNSDGVIQNTDADAWRQAPAINQSYEYTDGNLDRVVQNTDFDVWKIVGAKIGHVEIRY